MPLSYASAAASSNANLTTSTNDIKTELYVKSREVEMVQGVKEETEENVKNPNHTGNTSNSMGVKEPSLCIARLPAQMASDGVVMSVVGTDLGYGNVQKVDMIQKTDRNGNDYMMAFVHFTEWANTDSVNADREKLMNGEKIKVVYDEENDRYFTLTRSYTKSREQRNLDRVSSGPRYGFAHGKDGNVFKSSYKERKRYSKPFIDKDGWTTMPAYVKKTKSETAITDSSTNSVPDIHKRDQTNNFTNLDVDSD